MMRYHSLPFVVYGYLLGMIDTAFRCHGDVCDQEVKGVKRANVIKNIHIIHRHSKEEDEKVDAPDHLKRADEGEVSPDIEERDVAKPGHPHVARNHHSNSVIHFVDVKIVVEQEHDLHPPFPLLGLISVENIQRNLVSMNRSEP